MTFSWSNFNNKIIFGYICFFSINYFRRLMVLQSQNIVEYIEKIENSFSFKKFPHMSSRY